MRHGGGNRTASERQRGVVPLVSPVVPAGIVINGGNMKKVIIGLTLTAAGILAPLAAAAPASASTPAPSGCAYTTPTDTQIGVACKSPFGRRYQIAIKCLTGGVTSGWKLGPLELVTVEGTYGLTSYQHCAANSFLVNWKTVTS